MRLRAEFTVEPFVEGNPGPHVQAALDALHGAGFEVDVGPFGSVIEGSERPVTAAVAAMMDADVAAGATRVSLQVERIDAA